ncbi:MAG: class I SAM-dependent methyltransferase [Bacteroidetes bacterium]|jgi:2-polyprenyl-3-methyl-5-hydroxy-6-metoxy-1,4-benzoquinol methylase|nr:class I SAM-dependent methyltransferase [Bacteroidota bacterium]
MNNHKTHWENIYETKAESDFSWFQPYPQTSVDFINLFKLPKTASIIDIGGGDSHLADALLELGYTDITVLDISATSIERAKARLGDKATAITWIASDIVDFEPHRKYDFWHDRAAFHFLTTEIQIIKYLAIVKQGISPGGHLVLGTFSDKGPNKCSGLDVKQYTEASMSALFEKDFKRIKCVEETHVTPFSTQQNFVFCSFQRTPMPIL